MSLATPVLLKAEGFREPSQFGTDAAGFDAYLQLVLDEAAIWARHKLGATAYDALVAATTTYTHSRTKRAEACYAAAILWKRRAAFLDSAATMSLQEGQAAEREQMLKAAGSALTCAQDALADAGYELGIDVAAAEGGGISIGHVETGRYSLTSTAALNA